MKLHPAPLALQSAYAALRGKGHNYPDGSAPVDAVAHPGGAGMLRGAEMLTSGILAD